MNLSLTLLGYLSLASPIDRCKELVAFTSSEWYKDFCQSRCEFWGSSAGIPFCGVNVLTNEQALLDCHYKYEHDVCYARNLKTTAATVSNMSTPITMLQSTTTPYSDISLDYHTTVHLNTGSSSINIPSTNVLLTTIQTTTSMTTEPTTQENTPITTLKASKISETTISSVVNSTPSSSEKTPSIASGAGDAPLNTINGPISPEGKCVWGYTGDAYKKDAFAGVENKVYKANQWIEAGKIPGVAEGWSEVASCIGTAPTRLSDEEVLLKSKSGKISVHFDPWTPFFPSKQEIDEIERVAETDPQIAVLREAVKVLPMDQIEKITSGNPNNPENVKRVESFLSSDTYDQIFPFRHIAYSYENYLKAIGAFPSYCKTYTDGRKSDDICKKLVAASFAHYTQETGANAPAWSIDSPGLDSNHQNLGAKRFYKPGVPIPIHFQGLYWLREVQFQNNPDPEKVQSSPYESCNPSNNHPWPLYFQCPGNVTYYGRGSKQLSWNYNYGWFSQAIYNDVNILLQQPKLVADTWLNFASGIWFAVTPQSPKPPMTWALDGTWTGSDIDRKSGLAPGFGATIEIINGGYECGRPTTQAQNRIRAYEAFMELFNQTIPSDEPNGCENSKHFASDSPAATAAYWNKNWSKPYTCKRGTMQTPFSVTRKGDYAACVDWYWRSRTVYNGKIINRNGDSV